MACTLNLLEAHKRLQAHHGACQKKTPKIGRAMIDYHTLFYGSPRFLDDLQQVSNASCGHFSYIFSHTVDSNKERILANESEC